MRSVVLAALLVVTLVGIQASPTARSSGTENARLLREIYDLLSKKDLLTRGRFSSGAFGPSPSDDDEDESEEEEPEAGPDAGEEQEEEQEEDAEEVATSSAAFADCAFEGDLCGWAQDPWDDFDWSFGSGSTPSGSTGPSDDPSESGTEYMYIEGSSPAEEGDAARLVSAVLPGSSQRCLSFYYHMLGSGMGHLRVYLRQGEDDTLVWHRDGDQGDGWKLARINLESTSEYEIVIEGVIGVNYQSDAAIDDLAFTEEECYAVPVHCGENYLAEGKRIEGGEESEEGQWPWQVQLQTTIPGTSSFMQCGGTLIDPQWIVSAAHCIENNGVWITEPEYMTLLFGEIDTNTWDESEFSMTPELIMVHPDRTSQDVAPYDIMLIKLPYPLTITETVNVACLPSAEDDLAAGTDCIVSGWGIEHYEGTTSNVLMHVDQDLLPLTTCETYFGDTTVTDDNLCAGSTTVHENSCQGDSGGPLVCDIDGFWVLAGVVSFGAPCGYYETATPGVYASVQYFLSWIEATIAAN